MNFPLPKSLMYLEPVLRELGTLPEDGLHEDTDDSALEAVVRDRINGLEVGDAKRCLEQDSSALEQWLGGIEDPCHPGYWIVGYLSRPGPLARELLIGRSDADASTPSIAIECPIGWSMETAPYTVNLMHGEFLASIMVSDDDNVQLMKLQFKTVVDQTGVTAECDTQSVQFGECCGTKIAVYRKSDSNRKIFYFLNVPGGVIVCQCYADGESEDIADLEAKLRTLCIKNPRHL